MGLMYSPLGISRIQGGSGLVIQTSEITVHLLSPMQPETQALLRWLRKQNNVPFQWLSLCWRLLNLHLQPWLPSWAPDLNFQGHIQMHILPAPQMQNDLYEDPYSQPSRPSSWVSPLSSIFSHSLSMEGLKTLGHLQSPLLYSRIYCSQTCSLYSFL